MKTLPEALEERDTLVARLDQLQCSQHDIHTLSEFSSLRSKMSSTKHQIAKLNRLINRRRKTQFYADASAELAEAWVRRG